MSYGDSTAITITLASLADTGQRQAAAVENSDSFVDILIGGKIKTGTGSGAGDYVDIYASASADDGTTYGGDCSGADAAYAGTTSNLPAFLGRIDTETAETTFEFGSLSIAVAFGGTVPKFFTLVFENQSDSTLDATPANHAVHYQGVH